MQEIRYLLPSQKVFTSSQRVLLKNGFRIINLSESSKEITATKQKRLLGPVLKVNLSVTEKDGHTTLVIQSSETKGSLGFLNGKSGLSAEKLITELNTHIR
jgi:hypothetical protein